MLKRPYVDEKDKSDANKDLAKIVLRIWILLFIGLVSEALQINPSKFTISGIEFIINNGRFIAGIIYLIVIILYFMLLLSVIVQEIFHGRTNYSSKRHLIYVFSGKDKTFSTKKAIEIKIRLKFAKIFLMIFFWIAMFFVCVPIAIIIIFKLGAVFAALRLIIFRS